MTIEPKVIQLDHARGPWVWAIIGRHGEVLAKSPCHYGTQGRAANGLRCFLNAILNLPNFDIEVCPQYQLHLFDRPDGLAVARDVPVAIEG